MAKKKSKKEKPRVQEDPFVWEREDDIGPIVESEEAIQENFAKVLRCITEREEHPRT